MKIQDKNKTISITKASGLTSVYNEEKVKNSLLHAGATHEQAVRILEAIRSKLYNDMPTKEIFKTAYEMLKEQAGHLAARYNLKKAIMELGPSGFPFERYMAEIFKSTGHYVTTGKIMRGKCVNHEIDVVAQKSAAQLLIECKYHSQQGIFSDIKIPLYIHSRFNDVVACLPPDCEYQGWVVTNTRFSDDAIRYGTCAGLYLMGWDYPSGKSLKAKIDALGLYPITCLTTLSTEEKERLLKKNKVLCSELQFNPGLLAQVEISPYRIETIMEEVNHLCHAANRTRMTQPEKPPVV